MRRGNLILLLLRILLGSLVLLILMPVISARLGMPVLAGLSYLVFTPFCHQLPDRSFHLLGVPLAVCARCTGIYLGIFIGAFSFRIGAKAPRTFVATSFFADRMSAPEVADAPKPLWRRREATADRKVARANRKVILFLILIMALDGMLNALGIITTPIWLRFLFGLGFGIAGGWLLGMGVEDLMKMTQVPRVRGMCAPLVATSFFADRLCGQEEATKDRKVARTGQRFALNFKSQISDLRINKNSLRSLRLGGEKWSREFEE